MVEPELPDKVLATVTKGPLGKVLHLSKMLEFPLRMAADSARVVLVKQMQLTLGKTSALKAGKVTLGELSDVLHMRLMQIVELESRHIGQAPPEQLGKMGLFSLVQQSRALAAALLIDKLNRTANLGISARCDAGDTSEVYRSLVGCVLAAVKRSCHEAGLHRAAAAEIGSLHGWLREAEEELRREYRAVLLRHGLARLAVDPAPTGDLALDTTGDGRADTTGKGIDTTGDGVADVVLVDTTGDGHVDSLQHVSSSSTSQTPQQPSEPQGDTETPASTAIVAAVTPRTAAVSASQALKRRRKSVGAVTAARDAEKATAAAAAAAAAASGGSAAGGAGSAGGGAAGGGGGAGGAQARKRQRKALHKHLETLSVKQLKGYGAPEDLGLIAADALPTEAQLRWQLRLDALAAELPADADDDVETPEAKEAAEAARAASAAAVAARAAAAAAGGGAAVGDDDGGAGLMGTAQKMLALLAEVDRLCAALSERPLPENRLRGMAHAEAAAHLTHLGFPSAMLPAMPKSKAAAPPLRTDDAAAAELARTTAVAEELAAIGFFLKKSGVTDARFELQTITPETTAKIDACRDVAHVGAFIGTHLGERYDAAKLNEFIGNLQTTKTSIKANPAYKVADKGDVWEMAYGKARDSEWASRLVGGGGVAASARESAAAPPTAASSPLFEESTAAGDADEEATALEIAQDFDFLARLGLEVPALPARGASSVAVLPELPRVVAAVTGGGALWRLRRRYARLKLDVTRALPHCHVGRLRTAEARAAAHACVSAMAALHNGGGGVDAEVPPPTAEAPAAAETTTSAKLRRASSLMRAAAAAGGNGGGGAEPTTPAGRVVRFARQRGLSAAGNSGGGGGGGMGGMMSIAQAASKLRAESQGSIEAWQELADRYNAVRDELELSAGTDASAALFLPHVEGCTTAVTQFVAVSHPLTTLAHYLAGQQLMQARAWRDTAVAAAKAEWKSGKPPRDVLVAVMEQQGAEHKEVTNRVLEMVNEIEAWWGRLQQAEPDDGDGVKPLEQRRRSEREGGGAGGGATQRRSTAAVNFAATPSFLEDVTASGAPAGAAPAPPAAEGEGELTVSEKV